ncbi:sensor histidine kinase [Rheinheimera maricola]|uniref:Histidine kinase n=1 Tax=Rheinheimera maricola TaxID=2793282 RepID=A0ABS7XCX7_9GAMM|nr:histidine kinase [Rheinheimera maricola]MBZ9613206.1 histidine kinase [Rheinheimera maricola]
MLQRFMAYLQVDRTFLLLVFLFSYFMVISNRVRSGMLSWYTFTPEGPIAQFLSALLIFILLKFWLTRHKFAKQQLNWRHYLQILIIALLCYLAFSNMTGLLIAAIFGNIARNYNANALLQANLSYIVEVVIYAGIYLAYHHSKQAEQYRQQLADYNQQLAQLHIQQLKAQMNPHFVFNSLNTLDELITLDPERASQYLDNFAGLYRLSLHNAEKQLVDLAKEIEFSAHYFKLMQARVGEGYQLQIQQDTLPAGRVIPPFTVQVLLENVFLHNQGSNAAPLQINISATPDSLVVTNLRRPKAKVQAGNGIGLKNLARQLRFLTGRNLHIDEQEHKFSVTVPLMDAGSVCITP